MERILPHCGLWEGPIRTLAGARAPPRGLRPTMAQKFLEDNGNDLVGLAQILGHENLNTTARYTKRTEGQLAEASERLAY